MFSDHKPLYLLFRNEGETYFLNSTLQLGYNDYVWYRLKEAGYKYIYFLNLLSQDNAGLMIPDRNSYTKNTYGQGFFKKKLWDADKGFRPGVEINAPAANVTTWTAERLADPECAVVADVRALSLLFPAAYPEKLNALIGTRKDGAGTLAVTCPMTLSADELALFIGKNSIFAKREGGRCLLQPLYTLISTGNEEALLFDELKKGAADQMIELGNIDFDRIKSLMFQVETARDEVWGEEERLDRSNYLYYWLTNDAVRIKSGGLFDKITGTVTTKKLFDSLTGSGMAAMMERVNRVRDEYRKKYPEKTGKIPLSRMLFEFYGPRESQKNASRITLEEAALLKLSEEAWPSGCDSSESAFDSLIRVTKADWDEMRRKILKPRNKLLEKKRLKWLEACLTYMDPARNKGDFDTLRRTVNMLMYCGNNLYTGSADQYEDYCRKGRIYLDASGQYFDLTQTLKKLQGMANASSVGVKAQIVKIKTEMMKLEKLLTDLDGIFVSVFTVSDRISEDTFLMLENLSEDAEGNIDFGQEAEKPAVKAPTLDELMEGMSEEDAYSLLEN